VLQVVLSFVLFPKPLRAAHLLGGALTLAALYTFSTKRISKAKAKATPKAASVPDTVFNDRKHRSINHGPDMNGQSDVPKPAQALPQTRSR
jgi:hypothetical protein